ncbi:DUF1398 family protein [Lactococcus fujiensis]|uniref:DUF1398 domain-containing protein n=2 Tax=Lactococcus fujiensis TaxID=610251 RepID=A0A2A5RJ89_9LACT|nr:DUF1398 family protein [Lactococcus fujiensis]PCR99153.1 hypothetical protein RT41_GL000454 [Lactococcus fujiensis JCM 16395]
MDLQQHLKNAMEKSEKVRPKVGGFPYLAECLRREGFLKNMWQLPSATSFYISEDDALVIPGKSLIDGASTCPKFNKEKLIAILRIDQAGQTTFLEFLENTWGAGVVKYEVDFINRNVIYYGLNGEEYREDYMAVKID